VILPPNIALTAPELIIGLSALLLLVTAVFRGDRSLTVVSWSAVIVLLGAGLAMLNQPERAFAYGGLFAADRFAQFLKVTIYASAAVSIVLAVPALRRTAHGRFEYPILILLSVLGMSVMASAADLLTLYIGLELQSLALYVLAAFQRSDTRSSEAGLKYFLLGALSSGIMLFGISLVYGFAGTTQFAGLHTALGGDALALGALVGLVFTMVGLAFKVSAVPFHMWTPDVYEGAPTPVVAFFAAAPKVAAMGLFTRLLLEAFGGAQDSWQAIVAFMSVGSMFLGAVGAIGQTNFKRLMAYSSINNVGFALIGLAVGGAAGAASVLFYMAIYVVMTIGAFLAILDLRDPDGRQIEEIASLAGLNARRPGLAAALAFIMFSLAGIPPLLGFFPKLAVFRAAMDAGLYPLAILGVVASVVGAYYYLRIVKTMYFDEPRTAFGPRLSTMNGALLLVSAAVLSPLGWLALSPLFAAAQVAAGTLFPR
jgi:NADH-quinone oxidoreductase subunit N